MVEVVNSNEFPYHCIGKLFFINNKKPKYGTAYFVGNSTIVTAAHNIYNHANKATSNTFMFVPAYCKDNAEERMPFGQWFSSYKCKVPTEFMSEAKDRGAYDYGVIILDDNNSNSLDSYINPLDIIHEKPNYNTEWQDIGYPINMHNGNRMCVETGKYYYTTSNQLSITRHGNGLHQGTSGGPWIIKKDKTYIANGIHSGRPFNSSYIYTYSPYFSQYVIDWINNIKKEERNTRSDNGVCVIS